MKPKTKVSVGILSLLCVLLLISPACTAGIFSLGSRKKTIETQETSQSQYWALLFAVGVYEGNPDAERPEMLESCDDLYTTLVDSDNWQASNIHTVKSSQATLQNLIKELLWLRKSSNNEDYVLVYLTTHGNHLYTADGMPWDLPPKDETDASDEILLMYNGYSKWYGIIWDDLLNFFLSLIKCQGLCLIVDSCYSGGFNDQPMQQGNSDDQVRFTATSFKEGFMNDMSAANRVVLMSCEESTVSYGSFFSSFLIDGFAGWADLSGNGDGVNSAEETFEYAEPLTYWAVLFSTWQEQFPTIMDNYPGEFPVTVS